MLIHEVLCDARMKGAVEMPRVLSKILKAK